MARVPDLAEGDTITEAWCDAVTAATLIAPLRVADTAHLPTSTLEGREPGVFVYIVDVNRIVMWDGTGWMIVTEPVQTYNPPTVGLTPGNGTMVGEYQRSMGWCDWSVQFTWGSTSAIAPGVTTVTVAMPIAAATTGPQQSTTNVIYEDNSLDRRFPGSAKATSSTVLKLFNLSSSTTIVQEYSSGINNNLPFLWANLDTMTLSGRYRMASRYS